MTFSNKKVFNVTIYTTLYIILCILYICVDIDIDRQIALGRNRLIKLNGFFVVSATFPNILTTNVFHLIETRQTICDVNQLTGFYMIGNTVLS